MSPQAAKARGMSDRSASAPIGGHEGMPEDASSSHNLLEDQAINTMANSNPNEKSDGLMSELNIFESSSSTLVGVIGSNGDGIGGMVGMGAADEELAAMTWPSRVRSASMSSVGSGEAGEAGEAEESEVRRESSFHETYISVLLLFI